MTYAQTLTDWFASETSPDPVGCGDDAEGEDDSDA